VLHLESRSCTDIIDQIHCSSRSLTGISETLQWWGAET
jgi:hypothetical protein